MLPVYIQFIRNALCVTKTFLPADPSHFLRTLPFADSAGSPMRDVMLIELLVAFSQFAPVVFNVIDCYNDVLSGSHDRSRYAKALVALDRLAVQNSAAGSAEFLILRHSVQRDQAAAGKKVFGGLLKLVIAGAFFILTTNSLHVRAASHPLPVINALLAMVLCVSYFLSQMIGGITGGLKRLQLSTQLRRELQGEKAGVQVLVTAADKQCDIVDVYSSIVNQGFSPSYRKTKGDVEKHLRNDLETIKQSIAGASLSSCLSSAQQSDKDLSFDTTMTIVFFVLNFVAAYGYFLGVLAFYFPGDSWLVKLLMLGMSHGAADWWGGLVGDSAWTIEPVVVLIMPYLKRMSEFDQKEGNQISDKKND